jgi:aspartyl-tRNA(Asn)/glutamyl-tRNA(Gln) amidotransferase subunit C
MNGIYIQAHMMSFTGRPMWKSICAGTREYGRSRRQNNNRYNFAMPLSLQEVEHIAKLARLELTDEQKALYREQLEAILDYIAKLQELDTKDVPPTASISVGQMPLRGDEPRPSLAKDILLRNAPEQEGGQFKIPPVFE